MQLLTCCPDCRETPSQKLLGAEGRKRRRFDLEQVLPLAGLCSIPFAPGDFKDSSVSNL